MKVKVIVDEFFMDNKLIVVRERLGLTQEEVAKRMGWSRQQYDEFEGKRTTPDILTALKLAFVLKCDVNDIYGLTYRAKKAWKGINLA